MNLETTVINFATQNIVRMKTETHNKNEGEFLRYQRAKNRVNNLKAFYSMLFGYFLLMPFLIWLNFQTTPEYHWFWFPVIGCGLSLIYFGFLLFIGKDN